MLGVFYLIQDVRVPVELVTLHEENHVFESDQVGDLVGILLLGFKIVFGKLL